jgi:hypothetical protein
MWHKYNTSSLKICDLWRPVENLESVFFPLNGFLDSSSVSTLEREYEGFTVVNISKKTKAESLILHDTDQRGVGLDMLRVQVFNLRAITLKL